MSLILKVWCKLNELTSENPDPASFDFYMSDPVYATVMAAISFNL